MFSVEERQATIFEDASYRELSFWTGIVRNSPPVGAGAEPPVAEGRGMTRSPIFAASAFCHVPFSENAKSPVWNSCQDVVWVLLITEFGAYSFLTQSVQSCRADSALVESSCVSAAPAPQN